MCEGSACLLIDKKIIPSFLAHAVYILSRSSLLKQLWSCSHWDILVSSTIDV